MQRLWHFLVSHKGEAAWAAICAVIFGPLRRWISLLCSKVKIAIADLKYKVSTKARLENKILDWQVKRQILTEYLKSPFDLMRDLFSEGMYAVFLIGIGLALQHVLPFVKESLGPWRLLPAVLFGLAAFLAFDTARLATKKIQYEIDQIDKELLALRGRLEEVDPIAATIIFQ